MSSRESVAPPHTHPVFGLMRHACGLVCALLTSLAALGQAPPVYKGKQEKLPIKVAPQPISFNHKKHAFAGISCLDCHSGAAEKERAGLPNTERCMLCHMAIATEHAEVTHLAQLHARGKQVSWIRVYRVPDFVFFSHGNHTRAGEHCASCHGPVQEREVLAKEVSTSMIACMNCHAARQVSTECHLCHDLGQ